MTTSSRLDCLASSIIGVIDLRGGRAVHAIAGHRDQYRDVVASCVADGDAIGLAMRYRQLGISSLYIADLDAINRQSPNMSLVHSLTRLAKTILIDAGPFAASISKTIPGTAVVRFILPTESFSSIDEWAKAAEQFDSQQVVMGLDLCGNQVCLRGNKAMATTQSADLLENVTPWIARAIAIGVTAIVVLDLSYVGTSRGAGTTHACHAIARHWPGIELISGGGVRDSADVQSLLDSGCDQVLVATALHNDGFA